MCYSSLNLSFLWNHFETSLLFVSWDVLFILFYDRVIRGRGSYNWAATVLCRRFYSKYIRLIYVCRTPYTVGLVWRTSDWVNQQKTPASQMWRFFFYYSFISLYVGLNSKHKRIIHSKKKKKVGCSPVLKCLLGNNKLMELRRPSWYIWAEKSSNNTPVWMPQVLGNGTNE